MNPLFRIPEEPRKGILKELAEIPLLTIAWRTLHEDYQRRDAARLREAAEAKKMQEAMTELAIEVYRLQGISRSIADPSNALVPVAEKMEATLKQADVAILAPEQEPFTAEMMELFENVAQLPSADIVEPLLVEVVTPAILHRGTLWRMGKGVIAVPAEQSGGPTRPVEDAQANGKDAS
jgi:hypothetical protein